MSKFPTKKTEKPIDVLTNWVSISMALIFALPSLGAFLGIYYGTGNLIIAAVLGFAVHFVTLAFSGRISKYLNEIMN
ncbi:MAG: hypothetical protein OEQ94_08750 [Nitrosopumilus sp.]|nr:hypothetical protein [Nitrosopumilus sp.]MDH3737092.1 hypothetical protein [Nitrosopumilus sp.]MDH3822121.1 hypothetical protein [Nitrosopumilus sp.]MDH3834045.1 hypothetical protein [Nitrosopumilus sp.]